MCDCQSKVLDWVAKHLSHDPGRISWLCQRGIARTLQDTLSSHLSHSDAALLNTQTQYKFQVTGLNSRVCRNALALVCFFT
jgi:hypothetical protein